MSIVKLTDAQVKKKLDFIKEYGECLNAATGSKVDSNANVDSKNVATLEAELNKDINIQISRALAVRKQTEIFGHELATEYIRQLETHEIYKNDETGPTKPYCTSVSMYPLLTDGLTKLGGESKAPKHLHSFCGNFINFVFAISSQFSGACLYKNQNIIIKNSKNEIKGIEIKDFISKFNLNKSFENYQGEWQYSNIEDNKYMVWENGKYVSIKKVYQRKYSDKIYKIKTASGKVINCSADHVFKVLYKDREIEVKAKNLNLFDTVFNTNEFFQIEKNNDYKKGQLIGIIAGDGSITAKHYITVAINYNETFISDFLDKIFMELYNVKGTLKDGNKCYSYVINSKEILKDIQSYFEYSETYNCKDKYIDVNKYSLNFLLGFLDGLLVTDGGWNNSHNLSLINKKLIENVQHILKLINVNKTINHFPNQKGNRQDVYNISCSNQINKYLDLTLIKRNNNQKFKNTNSNEISYYGNKAHFNSSGALAKGYAAYSYSNRKSEHILDAIVEIEIIDNDDEYVYEIETESHWYSAGGILTHNCATVEYLLYFDYFARKDFGEDYLKTHEGLIKDHMQHVVYSINQPASARGYQSVFWNLSIFDKEYFHGLFGDFVFPDFSKPQWNTLDKLQKFFLKWLNKERTTAILTFPVVTVAMLTENGEPKDKKFAKMCSKEMSEGNTFFVYMSDNVDSLSSCCRLKNEIQDNTFSYSLGAGGIMTGSISVITLNLNRLVQDKRDLKTEIEKIHKYHYSYRKVMEDFKAAGLLMAYDAGFISLDKQFLTIGINGIVEAAESLGIEASNNPKYIKFLQDTLKIIYDTNKEGKEKYNILFNTEVVPGENLGVKNAQWDKKAGYFVPRECYNSYFYKVEDESSNVIDKFILHGREINQYLDGGSALHLNLEEYLTEDQFYQLFCIAAKTGCNYFTTNVKITICNVCKHIDKNTLQKCPVCGSRDIDYGTRIIGYLKRISAWSEPRQKEAKLRFYHQEQKEVC